MIISDDLLDIAAEIELSLHEGKDIDLVEWQIELLVHHFKSLIRNKPIGYMSLTGVENIHDCGSSTVHEESDDKRNIPVYIQY
ncbi:hypothetical protein [Providencia rettgeri]|uniref:hypothetical protein n=1 Tax=Providencia rettgeri TaxID=587 RepID=UPI0005B4EA1D|nr:hypothetical protein [Providencia rettgeri]